MPPTAPKSAEGLILPHERPEDHAFVEVEVLRDNPQKGDAEVFAHIPISASGEWSQSPTLH